MKFIMEHISINYWNYTQYIGIYSVSQFCLQFGSLKMPAIKPRTLGLKTKIEETKTIIVSLSNVPTRLCGLFI